jgi:hypothetical protein
VDGLVSPGTGQPQTTLIDMVTTMLEPIEYKIEDFADWLSIIETEELREYNRTKYLPFLFEQAQQSRFARRILKGLKDYRTRFPVYFTEDKQ